MHDINVIIVELVYILKLKKGNFIISDQLSFIILIGKINLRLFVFDYKIFNHVIT